MHNSATCFWVPKIGVKQVWIEVLLCFILCALISIDKDEGLCESLITHPFMYYHFRDKTCLCTSGLQQQEYSGKAGWHLCFGRFWVCNEGTWCCKTSRWWDSNNWGMADSTIWPVARVHNCFLQCRQTLGVEKTTNSRPPWKHSIKDFFLFLKLLCYEGEGICATNCIFWEITNILKWTFHKM